MPLPKLTRVGYLTVAGVGAVALVIGGKFATNFLGKPIDVKAVVPQTTSIQHFMASTAVPTYNLPVTATHSSVTGNCPVLEELAWQAAGGLDVANSGSTTAPGSDVAKYTGGGCLTIKRQDDYGQMEANLAKFVNTNGAEGDAFFSIMGDAGPYVFAALNKLIPGQAVAFDVIGFSDGEDKCMLPADWQAQMKAGTPILIAAVPRDGDWNICVKFASDNNIKINVDQKTVDPTAFNFVDVDSFTSADEKLIGHACEDRLVISGGLAHAAKRVCVNGVATWTPGDTDVVQKYPGSIVGVASTHDYAGQMPALLIGVKSWMAAHPDYVVGLIKAADRGAEKIRTSSNGLYVMGQVHPKVGPNAIPSYDDVVDLTYLNTAIKDLPTAPVNQTVASISNIVSAAPITQKVSTKAWHIEFDSGKATIKDESTDTLFQIEDMAAMTGLRLRVDGYTDNTGSNGRNIPLSEARAQTVADWLNHKAAANFPTARFEVRGHGSLDPVAGNDTAEGRAQNRRVEITMGN